MPNHPSVHSLIVRLARSVLAPRPSSFVLAAATVAVLASWLWAEAWSAPVSMILGSLLWLRMWAKFEVGLADKTAPPTVMSTGFMRAFMLFMTLVLLGIAALLLAARLSR